MSPAQSEVAANSARFRHTPSGDGVEGSTRDPGASAGIGAEVDGVPAAVAASTKTEQGGTLRGRLLRYPDPEALAPTLPVAGALVRLTPSLRSEPKFDFALREARSGPDGRYEIGGVPGRGSPPRLQAHGEGQRARRPGAALST